MHSKTTEIIEYYCTHDTVNQNQINHTYSNLLRNLPGKKLDRFLNTVMRTLIVPFVIASWTCCSI